MTTCLVCGKSFGSERALIMHTESVHGRRGVHQGVQMWEKSRDQEGELTTGTDMGDYTYELDHNDFDEYANVWRCPICSRIFNKDTGYLQHLRSGVHEEKAYQCQSCNRTFSSLSGLHSHSEQTGHQRAARQVRTMLGDASRQQQHLMLTDQSGALQGPGPPEGYLYFDGGAQPNPGVGGAGVVLMDDRRNVVVRQAIRMRDYPVTNNQAEYTALLAGLTAARREGMKRLCVFGDSDLVIKQMNGQFRVNSEKMRPLYERAQAELSRFTREGVTFTHVPRSQNTDADDCANRAIAGEYDFLA